MNINDFFVGFVLGVIFYVGLLITLLKLGVINFGRRNEEPKRRYSDNQVAKVKNPGPQKRYKARANTDEALWDRERGL